MLDTISATVLDAIVDTPGLDSDELCGYLYDTALLPEAVRRAAYKLNELGYVDFVNKRARPTIAGIKALGAYSAALGAFY